jgi:four helix bundle protein
LRIADFGLRIIKVSAVTPSQLKTRTKAFAIAVMRFVECVTPCRSSNVLGNQLLRAATSIAANYRAACRARSHREFVAKLGVVEEEADEAGFWVELIEEGGLARSDQAQPLRREASELVAIVVASIRTARRARPGNPQSAIRNPQSVPSNPQSAIRNPQCS